MWEIIGKLITPQEGEVSPLILQLVVAVYIDEPWFDSQTHCQMC